jgi:hypothetical protein
LELSYLLMTIRFTRLASPLRVAGRARLAADGLNVWLRLGGLRGLVCATTNGMTQRRLPDPARSFPHGEARRTQGENGGENSATVAAG